MTWGDTQVIQLISILRRSVQSQCRIHEILVAAMPIDINKPGQIGSGILPNIQHQEPWCQLRSIAAAFHAVQPGAMWNQLISWTCSKSFHVYADVDRLAKGLGVLGMLVSLSNYIMGCCLHLFVESVCLHHSRNIELKHGTHPTLFHVNWWLFMIFPFRQNTKIFQWRHAYRKPLPRCPHLDGRKTTNPTVVI